MATAKTETNVVVDIKAGDVPSGSKIIIPAAYKMLGAKSGYSPRRPEDLRLFIVGPPGEGKSTFISSIPKSLILDFEGGADSIPGTKAVRITIKDHDHYLSVIKRLVDDAKDGRKYWNRVTFDTIDEWAGLMARQLAHEKNVEDIVEYGQKGHGWSLLKNRCWSVAQELQMLGYAWTCVGHMTEKQITNPITKTESTVVRASVFPSLAEAFRRNSEFYATVFNIKKEIQKTKKRRLSNQKEITVPDGPPIWKEIFYFDCGSTPERQGKDRGVPNMKKRFEIPMIGGWDVFVKAYNEAVEEEKKKLN